MLTQQKIQIVVDMATKELKQELASLKGRVECFQGEISSLRSQLQDAKSSDFSGAVQTEPQQTLVREEPAQQPKQQETKPIDRNGVAPSDVSIEKMFYCGNKSFS